MNREEEILKEIKNLGKEIGEALGKLPPPSRHNSTIGAWRRIDKATGTIDDFIKDVRPGGKLFGQIRSDQVVFLLTEIRKTLVGGK